MSPWETGAGHQKGGLGSEELGRGMPSLRDSGRLREQKRPVISLEPFEAMLTSRSSILSASPGLPTVLKPVDNLFWFQGFGTQPKLEEDA